MKAMARSFGRPTDNEKIMHFEGLIGGRPYTSHRFIHIVRIVAITIDVCQWTKWTFCKKQKKKTIYMLQ